MSTTISRAAALAEELAAAGERFVCAARELEPVACELAALEGQHRAALNAAGVHLAGRPPARELATEVLLAACAPLRPFIPFVTSESGERAAEALLRPCGCESEVNP